MTLGIIQSILFLETLEEFLDFSKENDLDTECFCAAFLCTHGYDNFKKSMTAMNKVLDTHGVQMIVLEDYIYCDCEYTVLRVDKTLDEKALSTWSNDNFEIYL